MSSHGLVYKRVIRREAHSSKAGLAITIAVIVVLALAYVVVEAILALTGQPPLLVAPAAALGGILNMPFNIEPSLLIGAGVVIAIIGSILIVSALTPGRRADHEGPTGRTALLVDNRAIASALANRASYAAGVDPDQVVVSVGRRTAEVRIQPTSGWPVPKESVEKAVAEEIERMRLIPELSPHVAISSQGKVGA
jgi:hypothetical protein